MACGASGCEMFDAPGAWRRHRVGPFLRNRGGTALFEIGRWGGICRRRCHAETSSGEADQELPSSRVLSGSLGSGF